MMIANVHGCSTSTSARGPAMPVVYVVDDDASVLDILENRIRREGWHPETFASAEEFLSRRWTPVPSCLVLDATLPSCCCLEVQRQVADERPDMPVIFITDRGDLATIVQAMKAGAAEFLMKPIDDEALVKALRSGLARSAAALADARELRALQECYGELSPREQQVMALVVSGRLNKQVGGMLGISEITVKAHRGKVMRKLRATSLVDLVHMAARLRLTSICPVRDLPWESRHRTAGERAADAGPAAPELQEVPRLDRVRRWRG